MIIAPSPVGSEALDDPDTDAVLVRRMLADIEVANKFFGGVAVARRGLSHLLDRRDNGTTLTLLDVGTGAGDLPRALRTWAARRGVTLRLIGLERSRAAARVAHDNGVATLVSCGGALPLRPVSVDIVLLSQIVHHLDDDSAVHVLAGCAAIARRGVIVADLLPSRWAAFAFRWAGRGMGFHPITLTDGVTSLERGRRAKQMTALAVRAGVASSRVETRPIARVLLTWRTIV